MVSFDEHHLMGCRLKETFVEIWELQENVKPQLHETKLDPVWSCDVGNRNTVKCSAILFETPFAFIGKSNGRCDIWNTLLNKRIQSLEHEVTDPNIFLTIKKIILLNIYILTLTQRGKIFAWVKEECLESIYKTKCAPVWTCSSNTYGNVITDLYADNTRLVCLERSVKEGTRWLAVKDLWHCYKVTEGQSVKRKSEFQNKGVEKRKLCLFC